MKILKYFSGVALLICSVLTVNTSSNYSDTSSLIQNEESNTENVSYIPNIRDVDPAPHNYVHDKAITWDELLGPYWDNKILEYTEKSLIKFKVDSEPYSRTCTLDGSDYRFTGTTFGSTSTRYEMYDENVAWDTLNIRYGYAPSNFQECNESTVGQVQNGTWYGTDVSVDNGANYKSINTMLDQNSDLYDKATAKIGEPIFLDKTWDVEGPYFYISDTSTEDPWDEIINPELIQLQVGDTYRYWQVYGWDKYQETNSNLQADCDSNVNTNTAGNYTNVCTLLDDRGNESQITIRVEVRDPNAPSIASLNDLEVEYGTTDLSNIDWFNYLIINDDSSKFDVVISTNITSIDTTVIGEHDLEVTGTDFSGNSTTITHKLIVKDNIDPVVSVGDNFIEYKSNNQDILSYFDISDNYYNKSELTIELLSSNINFNVEGIYSANIRVTDPAGNQVSGSYSIEVKDTVAPIITKSSDVNIIEGLDNYNFDLNFSGSDSSGTVNLTYDLTGINFDVPGTYQLVVNATDLNGVSSSETFDITILGATLNYNELDFKNEYGDDYSIPIPNVYIDSYGDITDEVRFTTDFDKDKVGTYEITYFYIDENDFRINILTTTLVVEDNEAPTLEGIENIEIEYGTPLTADILLRNIKAMDNYDGDITVNIDIEHEGKELTPGTHEIKLTITDSSGNSYEDVVYVTVNAKGTVSTIAIIGGLTTIGIVGGFIYLGKRKVGF